MTKLTEHSREICYTTGHSALEDVKSKQERTVLERSARLNMDPGRDDLGDGGDR